MRVAFVPAAARLVEFEPTAEALRAQRTEEKKMQIPHPERRVRDDSRKLGADVAGVEGAGYGGVAGAFDYGAAVGEDC